MNFSTKNDAYNFLCEKRQKGEQLTESELIEVKKFYTNDELEDLSFYKNNIENCFSHHHSKQKVEAPEEILFNAYIFAPHIVSTLCSSSTGKYIKHPSNNNYPCYKKESDSSYVINFNSTNNTWELNSDSNINYHNKTNNGIPPKSGWVSIDENSLGEIIYK